MREIQVSKITECVQELSLEAGIRLGEDIVHRLEKAQETEASPQGREVLRKLAENARIAQSESLPICQDTGFAVVFMEIGQDVHFTGGDLREAVNEGIRRGYRKGYFRNSIVGDPLDRKNTDDNTPCVLYTDIVAGDRVKICFAPKGGGSENTSTIRMLPPSSGIQGVKAFVLEQVQSVGANACPPVIVGVGIGGTFEQCALLAKKALFRTAGSRHPNALYARLEQELLEAINRLGIGPAGFGGSTTALGVFIEVYPCHIASLPVAVNMQCHAARHKETII